MRTPLLFLILTLAYATVFGQGTIEFQTTPAGATAIPAHSSFRTAGGLFTLSTDGLFSGQVGVSHFPTPLSVSIYSSTAASFLGTKLFDLDPGLIEFPDGGLGIPGGQDFNLERTLTPSETNDLLAGNWWINVSTPDFPNGELRGQILAVPEPSSISLIALTSGAALFLRIRRRL